MVDVRNLKEAIENIRDDGAVERIAALERQIAELRAELINRVNYWSELYSKEYHRAEAAEAENARLRALPLKDEVERVLELLSCLDLDHSTEHDDLILETCVKDARDLLSRIRAGGHEGWRSRAADDVIAERRRQVEVEDWSPEHDDGHYNGELAAAASCYAYSNASVRKLVPSRWATGRSIDDDDIPVGRTDVPANWPDWDGDWWKPSDPRRNLIKAGALIIAEIERLDRSASPSVSEGGSRP